MLEWCHNHDEECRMIAYNAKEMYHKYVSRDGILDYLQSICLEIDRRRVKTPMWCSNPPLPIPIPISTNYGYTNYCIEVMVMMIMVLMALLN